MNKGREKKISPFIAFLAGIYFEQQSVALFSYRCLNLKMAMIKNVEILMNSWWKGYRDKPDGNALTVEGGCGGKVRGLL